MITISLCMIVKNESRILARCLSSVADLMDEIIIIDTGSTDNTKEIAREYTDKVFDFTWTGSFADARNYSFSKATQDYIYCADADEVLDDKNRERFGHLKTSLLPEIEIVQMYYVNQLQYNTMYNFDREYRPKLFRRLREFVWVHPIHEIVRLEPVVYDSDIEILHMPESLHSPRDFKAFRTMHANGITLDKRLHNLYAKQLCFSGTDQDFADARDVFTATMENETSDNEQLMEATFVLARACRTINDVPGFFKYALKNVALGGSSEICTELGSYYASIGDFQEASVWFYNAAFETQSLLNIHYSGDIPLFSLADCQEALELCEQATDYRRLAVEFLEAHP